MRKLYWFAIASFMLVSLLSTPTAAQAQTRFYVDPYGRVYENDYSRHRSYYYSTPTYRHDRGLHKGWYKTKHHHGYNKLGHWDRRYRRWY